MIKNNKQLTVTKRQLGLLTSALKDLKASKEGAAAKIQIRALQADASKLRQEIAEFEGARAGDIDLAPIMKVEAVGKLLVQGRIAAHLTQDELAREIGRKPQQIQRYETEAYRSASLATLTRVADVLQRQLGLSRRAKVRS